MKLISKIVLLSLMALPNIFNTTTVQDLTDRINQLQPTTAAQWGKMHVAEMLAHTNVTYEMLFSDKHPPAKGLMKWILKTFIKKGIVNEVPYKKNSGTAPAFIIKDERNFEIEKARLIEHLAKVQSLGQQHFEGKLSNSFGILTSIEWNNLMYKHLDHHLTQFGV
jgi:Protein of unknown function (DUF1569)